MASGVAWKLHRSRMQNIFILETSRPMAVRRKVSFSQAVYTGYCSIEGVEAKATSSIADFPAIWAQGRIPVLADPNWDKLSAAAPDVIIDAILAKRNLGTSKSEAPLVVGLGPGFCAGEDVHLVVETKRGHYLGRVIEKGQAVPNSSIPGNIGGYTQERLLRSPQKGIFNTTRSIGTKVHCGEAIGTVAGDSILAQIDGVIRGLLPDGTLVNTHTKLGDIDPRGDIQACFTISEKARAIGGGVLEAILCTYNR